MVFLRNLFEQYLRVYRKAEVCNSRNYVLQATVFEEFKRGFTKKLSGSAVLLHPANSAITLIQTRVYLSTTGKYGDYVEML
jgi:hypothetical protein